MKKAVIICLLGAFIFCTVFCGCGNEEKDELSQGEVNNSETGQAALDDSNNSVIWEDYTPENDLFDKIPGETDLRETVPVSVKGDYIGATIDLNDPDSISRVLDSTIRINIKPGLSETEIRFFKEDVVFRRFELNDNDELFWHSWRNTGIKPLDDTEKTEIVLNSEKNDEIELEFTIRDLLPEEAITQNDYAAYRICFPYAYRHFNNDEVTGRSYAYSTENISTWAFSPKEATLVIPDESLGEYNYKKAYDIETFDNYHEEIIRDFEANYETVKIGSVDMAKGIAIKVGDIDKYSVSRISSVGNDEVHGYIDYYPGSRYDKASMSVLLDGSWWYDDDVENDTETWSYLITTEGSQGYKIFYFRIEYSK